MKTETQLGLFGESFAPSVSHHKPGLSGQKLKEAGRKKAAERQPEALAIAREIARTIALQGDGTCHMDQVRFRLPEWVSVGPWAGSVFLQSDWLDTGRRVPSTLPSNHGRELRVWELRNDSRNA